jgi:gas vesicle protein
MMLVEDFENSLKEIQENIARQVEGLKEEAQKSLKEFQENIAKQVEDLKKEKSLKNYRKTQPNR